MPLVDYPDMVHDFIYFQAILPQAGVALRAPAAALKKALAPPQGTSDLEEAAPACN